MQRRDNIQTLRYVLFFLGWGATEYCGYRGQSTLLREVELKIVTDEDCKGRSGRRLKFNRAPDVDRCYVVNGNYADVIKDNMLCAETPNKNQGKGICFGDSGGPLTVEEKGRHVLVGVSSWIYQCNSVSLSVKM